MKDQLEVLSQAHIENKEEIARLNGVIRRQETTIATLCSAVDVQDLYTNRINQRFHDSSRDLGK